MKQTYNIHIKNMVCPRCILAVKNIFDGIGIEPVSIELGEVRIEERLSEGQKRELSDLLLSDGFELLTDYNTTLIDQIKTILIYEIHHTKENSNLNFSTILSNKLKKDYSTLSKLFSSVEGRTIERFVVSQKIEKVKELLFYKELSLKEIAYQLQYSSTAHLSSQFKKETGMTPTEFKKIQKNTRRPLDSI